MLSLLGSMHLATEMLRYCTNLVGSAEYCLNIINTEGPRITRILGLKKNVTHNLWSPTNAKIPHLRVHKPKLRM